MAGQSQSGLAEMEAGPGAGRRGSLFYVEPGADLCGRRALEMDESDVARRQRALRCSEITGLVKSRLLAAATLSGDPIIELLRSRFRTALCFDLHSAQGALGKVLSVGGAAGIPPGHNCDAANSLREHCVHGGVDYSIRRRVDGPTAPRTTRAPRVADAGAARALGRDGALFRDGLDPGDDQFNDVAAVACAESGRDPARNSKSSGTLFRSSTK